MNAGNALLVSVPLGRQQEFAGRFGVRFDSLVDGVYRILHDDARRFTVLVRLDILLGHLVTQSVEDDAVYRGDVEVLAERGDGSCLAHRIEVLVGEIARFLPHAFIEAVAQHPLVVARVSVLVQCSQQVHAVGG